MNIGAVFAGTFVASAVETIEMVIIVIGVGVARGWRSAIVGAGSGLVVLAGLIVGLRQALSLIPIDIARIVIGALLLTFGLQWLRKGIRRVAAQGLWGGTSGEGDVEAGGDDGAIDWTAFVLAFKGTLLEGLEIAFIVVAFGAGSGGYTQAVLGAAAALVLFWAIGLLVRGQLEKLPGRTLKFGVGGLLTTFGTFWSLEGLGVHWPENDVSIAWLYAVYLGASFLLLVWVRSGLAHRPADVTGRSEHREPAGADA